MRQHHKWIALVQLTEFGGQQWKCSYCGVVIRAIHKPKTSRDYRRVGVGKTCFLEMIRQIHDC